MTGGRAGDYTDPAILIDRQRSDLWPNEALSRTRE